MSETSVKEALLSIVATEDLTAELAKRGINTNNLWSVEDVNRVLRENHVPESLLSFEQKQELLEEAIKDAGIMGQINNNLQSSIEAGLPWETEIVTFEEEDYICRLLEHEAESYIKVAPLSLRTALFTELGEFKNQEAEDIDNHIAYYAEETQLAMEDEELLKEIYD